MQKVKIMLLALSAVLLCSACSTEEKSPAAGTAQPAAQAVIIDVRSAGEFSTGHLKGAINIPHNVIADKIAAAVPDKNSAIKLYCRSGRRVKAAIQELNKLNYSNLEDCGGINEAAQHLSLPVVK